MKRCSSKGSETPSYGRVRARTVLADPRPRTKASEMCERKKTRGPVVLAPLLNLCVSTRCIRYIARLDTGLQIWGLEPVALYRGGKRSIYDYERLDFLHSYVCPALRGTPLIRYHLYLAIKGKPSNSKPANGGIRSCCFKLAPISSL